MSKSFCLKYFWNYQKMQFLFSWYIFFAFIRDNFPLSIHYTEYLTTLNDILILIWSFYILSELGKCFKELLKGLDDLKYICSMYVKIYRFTKYQSIYWIISESHECNITNNIWTKNYSPNCKYNILLRIIRYIHFHDI